MRFLADENFPREAVEALRTAGHDVIWAKTATPGATDQEILALAVHEQRILLTFDKDFGELAANSSLPAGGGVVLFRIRMPRPTGAGQQLAEIVGSRGDWAGHFCVVEPGRIRMRRLA